MTEEPVSRLVIELGIPTMLSMLVTALYNTASTYYVSYLGTSAVGAMGVVFALQTIIQAIGIMIGQGVRFSNIKATGRTRLCEGERLGLFRAFSVFSFCVNLFSYWVSFYRKLYVCHGGN